MDHNNPNPLAKHFRQPAIYVTLPSNGFFYNEDVLVMPENKEIPIYPMTALDEIAYRTADALFNGAAIANVIKSCIPAFVDPWKVSTLDLDTLLIAIRIASYGHEMEFNSKCPKCSEINEFGIDLRSIMDRIKTPDFSKPVVNGDIEIHFKPLTYTEQNRNNMLQFQDQKMLEALPDAEIDEAEKLRLLTEAFQSLSELTVNAISDSISMIKAGDDIVVDKEHITEYIKNCESKVFSKVRKKIEEIKKLGEIDPLSITCADCKHQYETPFTMNVANFFESGS